MLKKLEKEFRKYFPKHLKNKNIYIKSLKNLSGIEIGGSSFTFTNKGLLPVYQKIKSLDGCNFSNNTVWEGNLQEGQNFKYLKNKPSGFQYIAEGDDLYKIEKDTYDFVLSCHNLEHFANPLKALYEWKRIVKRNGYLLLVLPDKAKTFDHNRPVTTLQHLIADFKNSTPESDQTHFEEVIALHDIDMDLGISSQEELKIRTHKNIENRCVHHHVFDKELVLQIMKETGFEVIIVDQIQINIFVLAKNIK